MAVHGYFDWLKRCKKRQMFIFIFGLLTCLEQRTVHMLTENIYKKILQYFLMSFQTGVFRMTMGPHTTFKPANKKATSPSVGPLVDQVVSIDEILSDLYE